MERIPDTPHALVDTDHRPSVQLPVLLPTRVSQQLSLLPHTLILQVLDAYGSLRAVDVMGDDDGVPARPWRYADFDLGVALCEDGERGFDEGIHALGTAPPIAVVEVEAFALQDEGADAILGLCDRFEGGYRHAGGQWRRL